MEKTFIPLSVPNFSGNEQKYVNGAVVSEWVSSGGSMVGEFEEKFAAVAKMPGAAAVSSGTAGLHLAMLLSKIGAGDEVIAPALTFIAAINPIRYVGATPVLIGCERTLCISPNAVEAFCRDRCEMRGGVLYNRRTLRPVRAIEAVHVFGNLADMERLCDTAQRYNLTVIEDATEAIGSFWLTGRFAGRMAGTVGNVGVYSFNGNKIITTGSGGMLVSGRPGWTQRAKHLSTQAKADELQYFHDEVGYNYRMTNLQAALGLAQLEQLDAFIARKAEMYRRYAQRLDGKRGLSLLPFAEGTRPNRWFYSLYLGGEYPLSRDALISRLAAERIQTRPIWGLIDEQPPYIDCEAHFMEIAREMRAAVVNLPCSTNLRDADIDRVCEAILSYAE